MDRKIISLIAALLVLSGCKSDKTAPTAPITGPSMTGEPTEHPLVSPAVTMAPTPKFTPPLTDAAYEEGATVTIVKSREAFAVDITELGKRSGGHKVSYVATPFRTCGIGGCHKGMV